MRYDVGMRRIPFGTAVLLPLLLLLLALPLMMGLRANAAQADAADLPPKRMVFEGIVQLAGKPIGSNILLEVRDGKVTGGWIQRNDFFPIDSGAADDEHIRFTSTGNQYDINLRTDRIACDGPEGKGNYRIEKMTPAEGRVYQMSEPMSDLATITLEDFGLEKDYRFGRPSIWKRDGPPIDRLEYERLKDIVGKNVRIWLTRMGGSRFIAVIEEPEGVDLQKKDKKEDKKKK